MIKGNEVRWEPAIDVVQAKALGFLLLMGIRSIVKLLAGRQPRPTRSRPRRHAETVARLG